MSDDQQPEPLTADQQLELAACYAEWCGNDPADRAVWRSEMVSAKKQVREWMTIWAKRAKKARVSA